MRHYRNAAMILLICLILMAVTPQTLSQSSKIYVMVGVSGDAKTLAESYIKRELRSLGDVKLVYTYPRDPRKTLPLWILEVIALKSHNKAGNHTGYIISFSISQTVWVEPYLRDNLLESTKNLGSCKNRVHTFINMVNC